MFVLGALVFGAATFLGIDGNPNPPKWIAEAQTNRAVHFAITLVGAGLGGLGSYILWRWWWLLLSCAVIGAALAHYFGYYHFVDGKVILAH